MAERGQYRSIHIALFDGKDFRALPSDARWILTLIKCNLGYAGIMAKYRDELTHRLAGQSGLPYGSVVDAIGTLEESGHWISWHDNIIWLFRALEFEPNLKPSNPLHRRGLLRHLAGLPRHDLVAQFIDRHPDWCLKGELREYGFTWAIERLAKGFAKPPETSSKYKVVSSKEKDIEAGSSSTVDNSALITVIEAFKPLRDEYKAPDVEMLANLMQRFHATSGGAIGKVIGEIAGALDGIHGQCRTWAELRTNIGDFLINPDARPSMAALRGYLYRNPDTSARNGAKPTAGQRAFQAADNALREV